MKKYAVTTAYRVTDQLRERGKKIAKDHHILYLERQKRTLESMMNEYDCGIIVVGKDSLTIQANPASKPFFFHPNVAMLRVKRWLKIGDDPLIKACKIVAGDKIVDATLGLGSDAILASLAAGKYGHVLGMEASFPIWLLVKEGLSSHQTNMKEVDVAMRRIMVENISSETWLGEAADKSVDIIYFDPMFSEEVKGSTGFDPLRSFAVHTEMTEKMINEARRVARKRLVLKDHFRSERFAQLGFQVQKRPSATYHYGVIEIE